MMDPIEFSEAVIGLYRGDFSRLESVLFERLMLWIQLGYFEGDPLALAEAFTAASFLGQESNIHFMLQRGVDPLGGMGTGMSALHWAANRGHVRTVRILIGRGAPLETKNIYGGTVLSCAVWSALHEPKDDHLAIVEALVAAGADVSAVELPTGDPKIDAVLRSKLG